MKLNHPITNVETRLPWRGLVKNRRKDGGFYWVIANASPVRENGQITGYLWFEVSFFMMEAASRRFQNSESKE